MPSVVISSIAIAIAACAAITDIRRRRIPNVLTFGAALAALVAHSLDTGITGAGASIGGWLVGAALFMPFFLLGGMGAGDVKLLAALGAWLGPRDAVALAIFTSIAGGLMAIVVALARGYLGTAVRNLSNLFVFWCATGPRPMPDLTLERGTAPRLAYALPIFTGTVVTLWLQ